MLTVRTEKAANDKEREMGVYNEEVEELISEVCMGDLEEMGYWLRKNPSLGLVRGHFGKTALMWAAIRNDFAAVEMLLPFSDLDAVDHMGVGLNAYVRDKPAARALIERHRLSLELTAAGSKSKGGWL